ncbi:ribonuclease H-like domain-containing protein [Tanacetum coccineum]
MKLMNLINEVPSGTVQANMITMGWIIDSRANQHMTISTTNMFGIIDITDLNLTVGHPNGTLAKIKYVGNLRLSKNVVLFDVLVVPEYHDLHLNKIMRTGTENGGLYMLGHPSDQVVDVLQSDFNFTKDSHISPCDICHKAKQTIEPFPLSDHKTIVIGELIHIDLWGPYKLISKDGFRHLLNVAKSLLFQSDLPLNMWTECILTAAYLINKLPSSVLNGKSLFELVYGFKPKLSHLRSFGHLCYSSVLNNSNKFYPRSTQSSDDCEDNIATSIGENTSSEGTVPSSSYLNAQNLPENTSQVQPDLRRSGRNVKLPAKFNDYVVGSSRKYGLEKYVSYSNLSKNNYCFSTTLNKSSKPTTYYEAVKNPNWIKAMNNEIDALNRNNTWTICDLPERGKAVGSKWLFKIKYKSTGAIDRYKARLVAKGFSQREGFDYMETFSLVVKMSTVRQAPRQWNAKLTMALLENGFVQSKFDYSLFTKKSDKVFIALLVYVDDIVIAGNDLAGIEKFKMFLKSKFQIKDLGKLKYFLGIEVLDNKEGICLSRRNYCLELLHEYGLLAAKHVDTPLPENTTLNHIETDDDHLLDNIETYQKLVGKLIYLTNTRPDISYVVHCLSQYMHAPLMSHLDAALRVLRYLKGSPGSGIQINKSGNLKLRACADSDWERKSVSEYRSMASAICEVIWLSNLLGDMGVSDLLHVVMYCDNSSALQIAANPVFHENSKHFEIEVHLVREKRASGVIKTKIIHTSQQIADVLTKALDIEQHKTLCDKLGMLPMLDMFKVEQLEGGC